LETAGKSTSSLPGVVGRIPALDLFIGKFTVPQLTFAVPMNSIGRSPAWREDGILQTFSVSARPHQFKQFSRPYAALKSR
jgi:hypothetical protein